MGAFVGDVDSREIAGRIQRFRREGTTISFLMTDTVESSKV
jgi:hypothetical protein